MARLWSSGFELNSSTDAIEWGDWNGAGASVAAGGLYGAGSYAMKILNPATGTRTGCGHQFGSAKDRYYVRVNFKLTTAPNVLNTIAHACNTATVATAPSINVSIRLKTDGALEVFDHVATSVLYTSSALTLGQKYRLEWFVSSQEAGGSNQVKFRIDGSEVLSSTNRTYSTDEIALKLGGNLGAEACTTGEWYFDDVAVNDEAGTSSQVGFPGDGAIVHLMPNAAGDNTEGAIGGSAPAATAWESVDEFPPDDGVTQFDIQVPSATSADPDRLDVNVQAPPSATSVTLVAVGCRLKPLSNASLTYQLRVKSQSSGTLAESSGVAVTGTAWVTHDDGATLRQYKLTSYTDPQAGGAWTESLLGTMQIGVRASDATPDAMISTLWALVDYVPAAATAKAPTPFRRPTRFFTRKF